MCLSAGMVLVSSLSVLEIEEDLFKIADISVFSQVKLLKVNIFEGVFGRGQDFPHITGLLVLFVQRFVLQLSLKVVSEALLLFGKATTEHSEA